MLKALRRWPFGPWNSSGLRRSRMKTSGASRTISSATGALTTRKGGRLALRASSQRVTWTQPASEPATAVAPTSTDTARTFRRLTMAASVYQGLTRAGRRRRAMAGARRRQAARCAARPLHALGGMRGNRRVHRIVGEEQAVEARHAQQLADALRGIDQHQLALEAAEAPEVADQLADAGGIDVVDAAEVDDHVSLIVGQGAVQGLREELRALAELDHPLDVEQRDAPLQLALLDDHGGRAEEWRRAWRRLIRVIGQPTISLYR